jgi:hypothetical protein
VWRDPFDIGGGPVAIVVLRLVSTGAGGYAGTGGCAGTGVALALRGCVGTGAGTCTGTGEDYNV